MSTRGSLIFLALLALIPAISAQQYVPDTTLTYREFLQQSTDLKNQHLQEVWVVNFWASWNSSSLYTIDGLKQAYDAYKNKPVRFVSISVDKVQTHWEKRLMQFQMPWEQLFVPKEADYNYLKRAYRHNSLPAMYMVNAAGQIYRVRDTQELLDQLKETTAGLPNRPWVKPPKSQDLAARDIDGNTFYRDGWTWHRVKKGDTLYGISKKYDVKVGTIKTNNSLSGSGINIGQTLKIKRG